MNHSNSTDAHIAAAPWADLFEAMTGFSDTTFLQEDLMASAPGYLSSAGSELPNFNAVSDATFTPAPTTSMGAFTNLTSQTNHMYPDVPDAWSMQGPHTSFVGPELLGDPNWTPFAAQPVAVAPNVSATGGALYSPRSLQQVVGPSSSATSPASQDELAWLFEAGQSTPAISYSPSSGGNEEGLVAPEYGALFHGGTTSPAEWDIGQLSWPTLAAPATSAPVLALGKRRREEPQGIGAPVDNHQGPPQKRGRGGQAKGILNATRSAARTRHKTVARIPNSKVNHEPKEAGRGAEGLATPSAQGIHNRPLQGPSFQQGWGGQTADKELIWVEGSVEEVPVQQVPVPQQQQQQQQQQEEAEIEYFEFPRKFKPGYKALLAATRADWARGSIREIKCRRCPNTNTTLKTWEDFKRHCDTTETHPLKILFCNHCGDFFARCDSLERHRNNRPAECTSVTPEKADEKRRETQRVHDEFIARLEAFLRTGEEDVEIPFSQMIKGMYPESSKKRKVYGR